MLWVPALSSIRAHGDVFSTQPMIMDVSHPNCAHTQSQIRIHVTVPRIGRGTWQSRRVIQTLTDTTNPELDSSRANAVHGRPSHPAGPCRIVASIQLVSSLPLPPCSVVSGSYLGATVVLRIITCPFIDACIHYLSSLPLLVRP